LFQGCEGGRALRIQGRSPAASGRLLEFSEYDRDRPIRNNRGGTLFLRLFFFAEKRMNRGLGRSPNIILMQKVAKYKVWIPAFAGMTTKRNETKLFNPYPVASIFTTLIGCSPFEERRVSMLIFAYGKWVGTKSVPSGTSSDSLAFR
jgi:hypothetical protein